ncbi:MAG: hypothetical protein P4L10_06695 [Acidobacteriaceae bacterium]|nr:hypothetical protein [Acidobacteriaceae bacterium]
MIAYLILLLAIVSRVVPHTVNLTAVGGSLLFFGARRSRWQAAIAMVALAATDFYLTRFAYGYAFHMQDYLVTWAWYAGVCLLGHSLLGRNAGALRVGAAVFTSATSFFVISNFVVWMGSATYAHSAAGLTACYAAAIPFYGNDLVSTGIIAGALFGLPALGRKLANAMHRHGNNSAAA